MECDITRMVPMLQHALDSVRHPGQVDGVTSKGLLWKEMVGGGGDGIQYLVHLASTSVSVRIYTHR